MARNTSGLTPWKPGQSGNMAGRAGVLPPEIRAQRKKNQSVLILLISKIFAMTQKEVEESVMAENTTQLERAAHAMIGKACEGDTTAFKYLMELMVGRIPETDHDGFTEEDLRILNRVKEVFAEQKTNESNPMGSGH